MTKLENLIEQTTFLLQKQQEAQTECVAIFKDLLSTTQAKIEQFKKEPEEMASLEHIYTLIAEQSEKISEEAQIDIDFLTEQLQALNKINAIKDPTKAQEMLSMLLDENEEIKDTQEFKKEIADEAVISKQNLLVLVNDIKAAIQEGSAKDVELYLQTLLSEETDDDSDFDDDLEDDEDGFDDDDCSCCSSKKNMSGKSSCCDCEEEDACKSCKGCVDIFPDVNKDPDKKSMH